MTGRGEANAETVAANVGCFPLREVPRGTLRVWWVMNVTRGIFLHNMRCNLNLTHMRAAGLLHHTYGVPIRPLKGKACALYRHGTIGIYTGLWRILSSLASLSGLRGGIPCDLSPSSRYMNCLCTRRGVPMCNGVACSTPHHVTCTHSCHHYPRQLSHTTRFKIPSGRCGEK